MPDKPRTFKLPKTIGACADRLYQLREQRLAQQKTVDLLAEEETVLREHLINTLPADEASGVSGKVARVTVVKKEVPDVKDWPKFYAHIKKTGDFALLGKSLGREHVKELLADKQKIPGLGSVSVKTVSLNKL